MHTMRKHALVRILPAILVLASVGLTACVAEEATPELVDPTGFVTYVHPSGVFTLDLPPEWVVNDTSDATALNVEFSPPNSPEPLISVYVVTADELGGSGTLPAEDFGVTPEASPSEDINALADIYVRTFYSLSDATWHPGDVMRTRWKQ